MKFTREEIEAADVVRKGLGLNGAPELYQKIFTAGYIHAYGEMQEESKWIPVGERLPENETLITVKRKNGEIKTYMYFSLMEDFFKVDADFYFILTTPPSTTTKQ